VKIALYVLSGVVVLVYVAYVVRAHRRGRLNFRGRPTEPNLLMAAGFVSCSSAVMG